MAWSPEAFAAVCGFPNVFPNPAAFGEGISFADPKTGMFLLIAADYLDAGVDTMCVPPLMITAVSEIDGALRLTIQIATPITINANAV